MIKNSLKNPKFSYLLIGLLLISFSSGCGIYRKTDAREVPVNVADRTDKNIQEGRGFRMFDKARGGRGSGVFEFASSNPMWRASLEILDFLPMTTVDYSGGIIISDWYSDNSSGNQDSIKITIRFLSNEIRSDSLKIIIHKKNCTTQQTCAVNILSNSTIGQELRTSIIRKASLLQIESKNKKKN